MQLEDQLPTPNYPTLEAPILRRLHGCPQEAVVSHGPSLSVCRIKRRGKLCVDLHLEWNNIVHNLLVQLSFRNKLYDSFKSSC